MFSAKRKSKRLKIAIVTILALAVLAVTYTLFVSQKHASLSAPTTVKLPPVPSGSLVDPSAVVYDARTTVPGTEVTFSYPKEGYYGKGIRLVNNGWPSDLNGSGATFSEVESLYLTSLHDKILNPQQISIGLFRPEKTTNLEDILEKLGIPGPYYPLPGRFESISGMRYYLQPGKTSDINVFTIYGYNAYAIVNGNLLIVSFNGGFDGGHDSKTPDLVTQFLSRLDFTCESDCSVNSAPIIESTGSEQ